MKDPANLKYYWKSEHPQTIASKDKQMTSKDKQITLWRKCSMVEAARWTQGRNVADEQLNPQPPRCAHICGTVVFTDGSAIACESVKDDDWSEMTPGPFHEPAWWIGEPAS